MSSNSRNAAAACQDDLGSRHQSDVSRKDEGQGNGVSLRLHFLRAAIDNTGWKHAAVAAIVGVEPQYFARMLSGEKPWTMRHQEALPDEIEREFARLYAEHLGLIAVSVPTSAEQARRDLVSGLFGLLHRLPEKAQTFAKADLTPKVAR